MNFKFFLFLSFTLPSLLTTERWKWIFFIMKISELGVNLSVHLENLLFQNTIMESRLLKNSTISPVRSFC